MPDPEYHTPIMVHEVIAGLQIQSAGVYVDCTFGGGGHSKMILEKLGPEGRLVAFDQDPSAARNLPDDPRLIFIPHNFSHLGRFLRLHGIARVHGILADLGVSSHQFDDGSRGFSTRFDARLDMRMNPHQELDADRVVNQYPEAQLHKIFEQYGEVTNSRTLAQRIVEVRKSHAITSIMEFRQALYPVVKGNPQKYFAQVFQALRIEVNNEMGVLKELLLQVPAILELGGRVAVLTFHSIEDRLVKNFFKTGSFEEPDQDQDLFGRKAPALFRILTKKPVTPSQEELKINPRSRSAKLRIAEKISG